MVLLGLRRRITHSCQAQPAQGGKAWPQADCVFFRVMGSLCPFCGLDLRTRPRLLKHFGPKGCQACAMQVAPLPILSEAAIHQNKMEDALAYQAARVSGVPLSNGPPALLPEWGEEEA